MEMFCVICKLAMGARVEADTVFGFLALCERHFDDIADVEFLDSVEREVVRETRKKWEAGR